MPRYTDRNGNQWDLNDWPGNSYKASVINTAYQNSDFVVKNIEGTLYAVFTCFWCGKAVTSAGVEGDHVASQNLGNSGDQELMMLYQDAQNATNPDGSPWNLVLSCSECNGGSRNKRKIMTRGAYRRDRDAQGPRQVVF
ncbi:hypothetical protein [Acidicapsa acidisoli]|uniref:hypothetical protein n=1 Tax=Acidicapsa acidisoli TaxID=1615681 RepID=UPI0021DFC93D|nr:hypothetical protein [Acidicapsa acidisoli]